MCRQLKFSDIAFDQALLSPCKNKHGAIITKGSKVVCKGFNNNRTKYLNCIDCCTHAEMDVARSFVNRYLKKQSGWRNQGNRYNLNGYILWVVRISNPRNDCLESKLTSSKPCKNCIKHLLSFGFNKIGYSDENGNIVMTNLNYMKSNHLSNAQRTTRYIVKNI